MLDKLTGKPVHSIIQFIGLIAIAIGLPWSKIPLSLGTILLGLNVILYWNWKDVWQRWRSNKAIVSLLLLIFFLLFSILWTKNVHQAANMLRILLPFFALPLAITAIPLKSKKQIHTIFLSFIIATFITSLINVGSYMHWWGNKQYDDIRSLSQFVSHIRYSMIVVIAIVLCCAWWYQKMAYRFVAIILIGWFVYYTNIAQIGTGYLCLTGVSIYLFILLIKKIKSRLLKSLIALSSLSCLLIIIGYLVYNLTPVAPKVDLTKIPKNTFSPDGGLYAFAPLDKVSWENGYPVYAFIVEQELCDSWEKVSNIPFEGKDLKGNSIKFIAIRYMTSKGLKKDAHDFKKLTKKDIANIEKGYTSIEQANGGLRAFLYQLRFQLKYTSNPNGKSLLERIEYVKTGIHIITQNLFFGVGIGDVEDSFKQAYELQNSKLLIENRHMTHNQYLTIWIVGGIVCIVLFCAIWLFQLLAAMKIKSISWIGFLIILILSFFVEDTLHTQAGATFTGFFMGVFLMNQEAKTNQPVSRSLE